MGTNFSKKFRKFVRRCKAWAQLNRFAALPRQVKEFNFQMYRARCDAREMWVKEWRLKRKRKLLGDYLAALLTIHKEGVINDFELDKYKRVLVWATKLSRYNIAPVAFVQIKLFQKILNKQ